MALTLTNLTLQDRQNASYIIPALNNNVTGVVSVNADGSSIANQDVNGNILVSLGTALSNLIDSITTFKAAGYIMNGTVAVPVQSAIANVNASSTDSILVAAIASKSIHVLAIVAQAGGTATNLTFNSKPSGAGTAISPQFQNNNNTGEVLPFCEHGWFSTSSGQGLSVTTGSGSTTGVLVLYAQY